MKRLFKILANLGIDQKTSRQDAKRISIVNQVTVTMCVISLPYFPIYYLAGFHLLSFLLLPLLAIFASALYINHKRSYYWAQMTMVLACNFAIILYLWSLGLDSGLDMFFFPLACIPAVVCSSKNRKSMIAETLLPMFAMIFFQAYFKFNSPYYAAEKSVLESIYYSTIISAFLSLGSVIYYFSRENLASERRLVKNNEHLESLNQELKEVQQKMIQSAKMSALGEMAGGVAHEINTPLAVIAMRAEQMEECLREGELKTVDFLTGLEVIRKTVDRIGKIVNGLRYFAREVRKAPAQRVKIAGLLDETLALCSERFASHGVQLEIEKSEAFCGIEIDCQPVEICQVILNLLNNAYDATLPTSQKWIRLGVQDAHDYIEISVSDGGAGIPPEIREKIMQPFFTTKEIGKGTGLGLSISKGIIEAHHGKLYLDKDSPFTRFVILIPKQQKPVECVEISA